MTRLWTGRYGDLLYPAAAGIAIWVACFKVIGPWLIAKVWTDPNFPIGGGAIIGAAAHPLDHYLAAWNQVSWYALPFVMLWSFVAYHGRRYQWALLVAVLIVGAEIRVPGLLSRSIWDDEAITLLQTSGNNLPIWPVEPAPAARSQPFFRGVTSCSALDRMLRETDVHPALYFCVVAQWKRWFGDSLEAVRSLSVVFSVASIFAFYLLLRAGGLEWPLIPTTVYAMSASAIFWGTEARPYAMAEFFVLAAALFTYAAATVAPPGRRAHASAVAAGACSGLALATHHLTAFPVGALLLWLIVTTRSERRWLGITAALVAGVVGLIGLSTVVLQLDARPDQAAGFFGVGTEAVYFFNLVLRVVFYPYFPRTGLVQPYSIVGAALIIATLGYLVARWERANRGLWTVLLSLAFAPPLGLILLNIVFQKHLHDVQYVHYSAAGLAALLSYPVIGLMSSRRALGIPALAGIAAIAALGINWGFADGPFADSPSREQAARMQEAVSPGQLVLIDAGSGGRTNPASLVYELDPRTTMLVFGSRHTVDQLSATVERYDDIWIRFSVDYPPTDIRDPFLDRLEQSGCYTEVSYYSLLLRLRREGECSPTRTWPSRPRMAHDFEVLKF